MLIIWVHFWMTAWRTPCWYTDLTDFCTILIQLWRVRSYMSFVSPALDIWHFLFLFKKVSDIDLTTKQNFLASIATCILQYLKNTHLCIALKVVNFLLHNVIDSKCICIIQNVIALNYVVHLCHFHWKFDNWFQGNNCASIAVCILQYLKDLLYCYILFC